jgi:hypothetical protein
MSNLFTRLCGGPLWDERMEGDERKGLDDVAAAAAGHGRSSCVSEATSSTREEVHDACEEGAGCWSKLSLESGVWAREEPES